MRTLILSTLSLAIAVACPLTIKAQEALSWDGFYAGVNAGVGWNDNSAGVSFDTTDPLLNGFIAYARENGVFPSSFAPKLRGGIVGAQAGYNWQVDPQVVLGFEADFQGASLNGSETQVPIVPFYPVTSTTVTRSLDWFSTARARIGLLATPELMVFVTAGLSLGETELGLSTVNEDYGCIVNGTICADDSATAVNVGWVAGAGIEASLAPNWSVKAEYLYVDLGDREATIASSTAPILFDVSSSLATQIIRVGVNYHVD